MLKGKSQLMCLNTGLYRVNSRPHTNIKLVREERITGERVKQVTCSCHNSAKQICPLKWVLTPAHSSRGLLTCVIEMAKWNCISISLGPMKERPARGQVSETLRLQGLLCTLESECFTCPQITSDCAGHNRAREREKHSCKVSHESVVEIVVD